MDSEVRPKTSKELGVKFRDPVKDGIENEVSDSGRDTSRQSYVESSFPSTSASKREKYEREKIGHRRVTESGQVTYKKKPTSELMACIMLGIGQSIGGLSSKPERDLLMQDFAVVESVFFPSEGSNLTPAHSYSDFRFKTYAPMAFRYFRELFGIQPDDFLYSMCNDSLVELSNPGASGSVFYITSDDEFIIKTLQHKEAEFLQKLLPGYYMNLNQNPRTLLPKFYGLFCYQCGGKNIRFCVMNNLLPSAITKHEKYDLKGSTYKRKASKREVAKKSPTLKDLDFIEIHPDGIAMEPETYNALMKTLMRDGRVLESFKIMDYSLLLAVHNVDTEEKESSMPKSTSVDDCAESETSAPPRSDSNPGESADKGLSRGRSVKTRLATYSTPLESIHADSQASKNTHDSEEIPTGGIPAKNARGERLLLFVGIIDILQNYRLRKKMEHTLKSIVHDGDTISVHRPSFYSSRFLAFFTNAVFKKIPTPLKHSPSKKKGWGRQRTVSHPHDDGPSSRHGSKHQKSHPEEQGAIGGRPDLLPAMSSTPPPTFQEAVQSRDPALDQSQPTNRPSRAQDGSRGENANNKTREATSTVKVETTSSYTSHPEEYRVEENRAPVEENTYRAPSLSPVPSNCESTPTHTEFTEGTPSFTTSSASVYSDTLDNSPVTSSRTRTSDVHQTSVTTATQQSSSVTMVTHQTPAQSSHSSSETTRSPSNAPSGHHRGYNDCEQHIVSPD